MIMSARLPGAIRADGMFHNARGKLVAARSTACIGSPARNRCKSSSMSPSP
jgi:hypothetical protein